VSTGEWIKKLKALKTMAAQRFVRETLRFEEVILVDE
jgi:hypothetical protein